MNAPAASFVMPSTTVAAVARILIIAGGARGRALAGELIADGHAVRITTRGGAREAIEAVGAECWIGTPERVATLRYALEGVTLACWLLGTACGAPEALRALHGSRLDFFVGQTIDTTVRGLVYEAVGSVDAAALAAGRALITEKALYNAIPLAVLDADPGEQADWVAHAREAIAGLL
jgi:UDP:flavonoid glycosyltransferase YjiC (YdhE family)